MANIKSSKKRILIAERNRLRNVAVRSSIKTAVKKVLEALPEGDKDDIQQKLNSVYKLYDKAASKKILHKNTVARKKSRLTRTVNKALAAE